MVASLRCRCGQVSISFAVDKPVHAWECCCVDCYAKNVWSCKAGNVPVPPALGEHGAGKPLDIRYYPSKMVVSNKQRIAFNRLRDGATSTNMVTTCCKTILCVDHPAYQGNIVLMFPEFCPLIGAGELPDTPARVFIKDWPEAEYAKLPAKPGLWIEADGTFRYDGDGEEHLEKFMKLVSTPHSDAHAGETFAELLAQAGGTVENLGLPSLDGYGVRVEKAKKKARITLALVGLAVGAAISCVLGSRRTSWAVIR